MKYTCLRDCFVDKMYKKGETYNLSESIGGNEKNFRLLENRPDTAAQKPEAVKITPKTPAKAKAKVEKPASASKAKKAKK